MTERPATGLRPAPRLGFGLTADAMPIALATLVGTALGPYGLGILSARVLQSLDPAMPVALAALGVFVGMGVNLRVERDRRLLAATSIRAAVTIVLVGTAAAMSLSLWQVTLDQRPWVDAAVLAISASDDPFSVLAGGIALAFIRSGSPEAGTALLLAAMGITIAIAMAGWLLLSESTSTTEQRVFVIALLLLLGGAAEYLSLSALLAGLVAGLCWEAIGGATRTSARRDVMYVQRPLVLLILIVSGAQLVLTPLVLAVALPYLVVRLVATAAGAAAARRVISAESAIDSGAALVPPGIVGLAFAFNAARAAGSEAAAVLSVVVVGVVGAELLAPFLQPKEPEA